MQRKGDFKYWMHVMSILLVMDCLRERSLQVGADGLKDE